MNADRFTEDRIGKLVKIHTPDGDDWAFIPNPLPPDWELPNNLQTLLGDAREQLGTLNGIGQTLNNPSLLLTPLRQREALRSSSLEGTHATPMELLVYEMNPRAPKSENDEANTWLEVANHNKALGHGCARLLGANGLEELPLCLRLIKETHAKLLTGVRGRDKRPGQFRDKQVHIGSDRRYIPPPPTMLAKCLEDFESFLHNHGGRYTPLVLAYLVHYQFEAIHPFLDGNGRIGRVLLSLTTYLWHGHAMPWLYMSAFFDRYKDEYQENLFRVSTHGDWDRWIEYCLRGTVSQCKDAIRRCEALNQLQSELHQKGDELSPRMRKIIDCLFDSPVFRVSDIKKMCGTSMPTARADVQQLVDAGIIEHLRGRRPMTFFTPGILDIAYSENDDL